MKEINTINIIGGGIAGLTMALALEKKEISYNLFESSNEITCENVGLGISGNIFHMLDDWNILNETKKIGAEIRSFTL